MKKTVGSIATELLVKMPDTRDPIEQMREQLSEYEKEFAECVKRGRTKYAADFYVVVLTKKERLLENVLRHYFIDRKTCPTPDYDQAVYKYHYKQDRPEFLWVIPSKDTCELLRDNALSVHESERDLLKCVISFYDGSLLRYVKMQNGERSDSPLLLT